MTLRERLRAAYEALTSPASPGEFSQAEADILDISAERKTVRKTVTKPAARSLKRRRLNAQQARFVQNVVDGWTPAESAEMAGYGTRNAPTYTCSKAASHLLSKSWVAQAIRDGKAALASERAASRPPISREEVVAAVDAAESAREAGAKQSEVSNLLRLAELKTRLFMTKEQPAPPTEPPSLAVDFVSAAPRGSQTMPTPGPTEPVLEGQPSASGASGTPETAPNSHSGRRSSEAAQQAKPTCPKHGAYAPRWTRLPGTNRQVEVSVCPGCEQESKSDLDRLSGLLPGERSWTWRN